MCCPVLVRALDNFIIFTQRITSHEYFMLVTDGTGRTTSPKCSKTDRPTDGQAVIKCQRNTDVRSSSVSVLGSRVLLAP